MGVVPSPRDEPSESSSESRTVRIFKFGVFELRPESRELWKHGIRVKLQTKPFQVLEALLTRPGEVVTREELCKKLWPSGIFVDFESGLNTATNRLRTVLGDSADAPRYIETLPRLGYRFICPVSEKVHQIGEQSRHATNSSSVSAPVELTATLKKTGGAYRALAAVLLLMAVLLVLAYLRSKTAATPLQQGIRQTTVCTPAGLVRPTSVLTAAFLRAWGL